MQGVTTVIVAFIFACIAFPQMIKNRPQFFAAVGLALLIIAFDCLGNFSDKDGGFRKFTYFLLNAIFQIAAILMLILSAGSQTVGELAGEMQNTIEVIRRGGEKKEIIVPLKGEQPHERSSEPAPPQAVLRPAAGNPRGSNRPDEEGPIPMG